MKTITKLIITVILFGITNQAAKAQFVVTDPTLTAVLQTYKTSELAKWVKQLEDMATQIEQGIETIEIIDKQLEVMGDPLAIAELIELKGLLERIKAIDGQLSMLDIRDLVDGIKSLTDTDGGLYKAIPMETKDGDAVDYDPEKYKKFSIMEAARDNVRKVEEAIITRNNAIRRELAGLAKQAKGAATDSEVQKIAIQTQVLSGELQANQMDLSRANAALQNQASLNNNQAKKSEAALEDRETVERRKSMDEVGRIFSPKKATLRTKGRFFGKD